LFHCLLRFLPLADNSKICATLPLVACTKLVPACILRAKTSVWKCLSVLLWQGYSSKQKVSHLFCMIRFFENMFCGKGTFFSLGCKRKVTNLPEKEEGMPSTLSIILSFSNNLNCNYSPAFRHKQLCYE